jgi:uncharacterized protein YllA (UPF0747 family)
LKKVFDGINVPYPVLVLRNSFLFADAKNIALAKKIGTSTADLFKPEQDILNDLVKRESKLQLNLKNEQAALQNIYEKLKAIAGAVDITLAKHTEALQVQALKKVAVLEKKMLRAEKRKFETEQRQLQKLRSALFPLNSLQERIENLIPFYAQWGDGFIKTIYSHSLALQQQFVILQEDE